MWAQYDICRHAYRITKCILSKLAWNGLLKRASQGSFSGEWTCTVVQPNWLDMHCEHVHLTQSFMEGQNKNMPDFAEKRHLLAGALCAHKRLHSDNNQRTSLALSKWKTYQASFQPRLLEQHHAHAMRNRSCSQERTWHVGMYDTLMPLQNRWSFTLWNTIISSRSNWYLAQHMHIIGILHKRATTHFKFFKLHVGSCPFSFWLGTTALPVWPLTCTYGSVQATAFVWSNASEWFFQVMHGIQFNLGQHVSNSATSFQEA